MKSHLVNDGQHAWPWNYKFGIMPPLKEVFESSGEENPRKVAAALAAKLTSNWSSETAIAAFDRLCSFLYTLGNTGAVKGTAFSVADILAKDDEPVTMLMITDDSLSLMLNSTGL